MTDEAPPWFNIDFVRDTISGHFRRCELIRLAGGIALKDVVEGTATVPPGWVMDIETYYFIPPGFEPSEAIH